MKTRNLKVISGKIGVCLLLSSMVVYFVGCGASHKLADNSHARKMGVSLLGGPAAGGLVENTKLAGKGAISKVDAITGATKSTANAGLHIEFPIKNISFETGIDYLSFDQTVTYAYASGTPGSDKNFHFHQCRAPLTINFHFLNSTEQPRLVFRAGISAGYTFTKSISERGTTIDYTFKDWDFGPTVGASYFPFHFTNGQRLGVYVDLYRGSKIYDDIFHQASGLGAQSFLKFGIVFQPFTFQL